MAKMAVHLMKKEKASREIPVKPLLIVGTRGRTRTGMTLQSADFESAVSTISPLWRDSDNILYE